MTEPDDRPLLVDADNRAEARLIDRDHPAVRRVFLDLGLGPTPVPAPNPAELVARSMG